MLKYLLYISVGYLIFKVVKNGAYLVLETYQKKGHLPDSPELIKCAQCEGFVSKSIALSHQNLQFCSEKCLDEYKQTNDDI